MTAVGPLSWGAQSQDVCPTPLPHTHTPFHPQEVRLYFVDPISMEFDEKSGFALTIAREWVIKAMPYIKVEHNELLVNNKG